MLDLFYTIAGALSNLAAFIPIKFALYHGKRTDFIILAVAFVADILAVAPFVVVPCTALFFLYRFARTRSRLAYEVGAKTRMHIITGLLALILSHFIFGRQTLMGCMLYGIWRIFFFTWTHTMQQFTYALG